MSYFALATTTLTSAASSVTFSSIPTSVNGQALRDLVAVVTTAPGNLGVPGGTARNLLARLNGDSSNVYTRVIMSGDGATARSASDTQTWLALDWYAHSNSTTHLHVLQIMDFSSNNKHKTVLTRVQSTNATDTLAHRWPSNSVINSLTFLYDQNTLAAGCIFSLYGIAG